MSLSELLKLKHNTSKYEIFKKMESLLKISIFLNKKNNIYSINKDLNCFIIFDTNSQALYVQNELYNIGYKSKREYIKELDKYFLFSDWYVYNIIRYATHI